MKETSKKAALLKKLKEQGYSHPEELLKNLDDELDPKEEDDENSTPPKPTAGSL